MLNNNSSYYIGVSSLSWLVGIEVTGVTYFKELFGECLVHGDEADLGALDSIQELGPGRRFRR